MPPRNIYRTFLIGIRLENFTHSIPKKASNASMPTLTPAPVPHPQSGGNNLNNGMPTLTPKPGIKSESESEREDHHHHSNNQSNSRKSNGLHSFWDRTSVNDVTSGSVDEKPVVQEEETGSGSKFIPTVNGSSLLDRHLVNGHSNGPLNGSSGAVIGPSSSVLEDISDDEMDISDSDEYDENEMNASLDETTSALPNEDSILEKDESSAPVPVPAPPPLRPRPSRFSDSPNVTRPPSSGPPPLSLRGAAGSLKPITIQNDKCKPIERKFSNQAPIIDQSEPPKIPEFKKILEPEYHCSKDLVKAGKDSRKMECECRPNDIGVDDIPCGEDCFNRVCFIECSNRCRFGEVRIIPFLIQIACERVFSRAVIYMKT